MKELTTKQVLENLGWAVTGANVFGRGVTYFCKNCDTGQRLLVEVTPRESIKVTYCQETREVPSLAELSKSLKKKATPSDQHRLLDMVIATLQERHKDPTLADVAFMMKKFARY